MQLIPQEWRWLLSWISKKWDIKHPPYFINLEPTSYCNLKCQICSFNSSRPSGFMEMKNFISLVDQAAAMGIKEVRLFLAGEPLLHPEISKMVEYVSEKGLISCIHSNVTKLNEKISKELIQAGLDVLSCSVDSDNKEEYENTMKGANFEQTIRNIKSFIELKQKTGKKKPQVVIQVIKKYPLEKSKNPKRLSHVQIEIANEFKKNFALQPPDKYRYLFPHRWVGSMQGDDYLPYGAKYFPCPSLWQGLSITWDGKAIGCCADLNAVQIIEETSQKSLSEIWFGEKMRGLRKRIVEKNIEGLQPCQNCDYLWRNYHPIVSWSASNPILKSLIKLFSKEKWIFN